MHNRHRSGVAVRQHTTSDPVRPWPACHAPIWARCVQPRTLAGQGAHHEATAPVPLDVTLMRLAPRPHGLADVPRGIVPYHQQRLFPFRRQACRQSRQKLCRRRTDRPPVYKTEEHALCISA
jgi:hypothetical protein